MGIECVNVNSLEAGGIEGLRQCESATCRKDPWVKPLVESAARQIRETKVSNVVVLKEGRKVMPYDLAAYPEAPTYLCTYNILLPRWRR
jgi:hypothetical protein